MQSGLEVIHIDTKLLSITVKCLFFITHAIIKGGLQVYIITDISAINKFIICDEPT